MSIAGGNDLSRSLNRGNTRDRICDAGANAATFVSYTGDKSHNLTTGLRERTEPYRTSGPMAASMTRRNRPTPNSQWQMNDLISDLIRAQHECNDFKISDSLTNGNLQLVCINHPAK